jgi:nitroimidazol reductase NimA-like FMN-containing flavoprotein (pyridoxamine 5'-phosphate oxidase superfamily)
MCEFAKTERNKVVRGAKRASYDKDQIFEILDAGFLCHLSFVVNGEPFSIPTAFGRIGDVIYVHGSVKSRTMKAMQEGIPVCVTVTHVDGLVLARSAFHHSVNYRSAVIFGKAQELVTNEEKNEALFCITENVLKGRWDEVRVPNQKELDITAVLKIKIDSASAKIRAGAPVDDKEDYELNVWAGELPFKSGYDEPISDDKLAEGIAVSDSAIVAWENSNP